jgi:hypothetical protein
LYCCDGRIIQIQKRTVPAKSCAFVKTELLVILRSHFNMDVLLTAQFAQNYFFSGCNSDVVMDVESIRALLGLATGALLAAGESFKQYKDDLGKNFSGWMYSNNFVLSDVNKLIKLFDYFGDSFDELSGVNVLELLKLLAPSQRASRAVLSDAVDEVRAGAIPKIRCADIDSISKQHKIISTPTIKRNSGSSVVSVAPSNEDSVSLSMVGNQLGGTGIFRLEVKDYELANQLDSEWKESSMSKPSWVRFLSESARAVQEIAQVVLGRKLNDASELDELTSSVLRTNHLSSLQVKVEDNIDIVAPDCCKEVTASSTTLPDVIQEILNKFSILGGQVIRLNAQPKGISAMMQSICRTERDILVHELKQYAESFRLNVDSLLNIDNPEIRAAVAV